MRRLHISINAESRDGSQVHSFGHLEEEERDAETDSFV